MALMILTPQSKIGSARLLGKTFTRNVGSHNFLGGSKGIFLGKNSFLGHLLTFLCIS